MFIAVYALNEGKGLVLIMKKMKVCVYAISKNESKFVKRWVSSMKEADDIYVLDTGSTDDTVELLKQENVHVESKVITPWRFDVARNLSLDMVPQDTDICVCTDLDEVFTPGWRSVLEKLWSLHHLTRLKYLYHWSFDEQGNPAVTFHITKIHSRQGYLWKHPVHEVLVSKEGFLEQEFTTNEVELNHYPDQEKSRSSYLPLLEMSVEEDPEDDRNMHYLGREYMYYEKWDDCIATLHRHLKLPRAVWKDERCASMRFMARSYYAKGYLDEAKMWYEKAIVEAPYLREGYLELAFLEYELKEYQNAYRHLKSALSIREKSDSYINEVFAWNEYIYDLLSLVCYELGFIEEAYLYSKKAVEMNPTDERLKSNLKLISSFLNS